MSIYTLNYYVYAYFREDGTPYYIGKGSSKRAWSKKHNVKIPKNKSNIIIVENNLSEIGALAIERRLIRWYGRKDNGTGILRNLTDGGDGTIGMFGKSHSQQTKNKISESRKGIVSWNKGISPSEETRKKLSKTITGRIIGNEARKNMSLCKLGKVYERKCCPHCGKIAGANVIQRWHFDNCKQINTIVT